MKDNMRKHKTDYILKKESYFDGKVMQRPQRPHIWISTG